MAPMRTTQPTVTATRTAIESPSVPIAEVRRIAAELEVDPRSVEKELRRERVRGIAGEKIRRALEARGLPTSDRPVLAA